MADYKALQAAAAKLTDEELVAQMKEQATALSVLWRQAETRESCSMEPTDTPGVMRDGRYGKKLFVSVGISDRRGIHVTAMRGELLR